MRTPRTPLHQDNADGDMEASRRMTPRNGFASEVRSCHALPAQPTDCSHSWSGIYVVAHPQLRTAYTNGTAVSPRESRQRHKLELPREFCLAHRSMSLVVGCSRPPLGRARVVR